MRWRDWLFDASAPASVILVRLLVGWVFLSEGVQKFLFPAALGVGRFERIGIPAPHFFAPFVGVVETVFGLLLMIGLLTRVAAIPLMIDISVAIAATKVPMLAKAGFWSTMHEARTDLCMLLGSVFLIAVGGGPLSVDTTLRGPGKSIHP
ncbi:MAG: DoxX family protein [Terriglobales bacterium]